MKAHHVIYALLVTWALFIAASFLLFEYLPADWSGRKPALSIVFAMVYLIPVVAAAATISRFKPLSWLPRCLGLLPSVLIFAAFVVKALHR